jgi:hypothetical protein
MPTPLMKKLAKEHNTSIDTIERYWDEAKDALKKQGKLESDKYFYATVVKIVKSRLGINEKFISYDEFCMVLDMLEATATGIADRTVKEVDVSNIIKNGKKLSNNLFKLKNTYYLVQNNNYIASIDITTDEYEVDDKTGIIILSGHASIRGGYKELFTELLNHRSFILSDKSLSDDAIKFYSKLNTDSGFKVRLYDTNTDQFTEYNSKELSNSSNWRVYTSK